MSGKHRLLGTTLLILAAALSGCGDKAEKKPGQALASVNGEEITVLQLNEELARSGATAAQQEAARKQLLEALIDRQLLIAEATKEKVDRDPKVVQAIERAKSLIVAQAYLQRRVGTVPRPTKAEAQAYYDSNPQLFANRKQFEMRQLVLSSNDISPEVKTAIDGAKSLEEVAAWLDEHKVAYSRAQLARSSAELPAQLTTRLLAMSKGQLFIIREGDRSMLISIADIKDTPVPFAAAERQIEQFLTNKKTKELSEAEVKRLRASAKVEYLNNTAPPAATPTAAAPAATPGTAAPAAAGSDADANARGVAGLK